MAKYTTGDGGAGSDESCELCGATDVALQPVRIAGADLQVCKDCADHREQATGRGDDSHQAERRREAARNSARAMDAASTDDDWQEAAAYDDDQLPYLVNEYGDIVTEARQEAGLQRSELAAELGVDESDIIAVEQDRANQAGVPGSLIDGIESRLDVSIVDEE
ncbi:MAG: multiprotein-bridging factor 1 family protein [Halococcoides sp.]